MAVEDSVDGNGQQRVDIYILNNNKRIFHIASSPRCRDYSGIELLENELRFRPNLHH